MRFALHGEDDSTKNHINGCSLSFIGQIRNTKESTNTHKQYGADQNKNRLNQEWNGHGGIIVSLNATSISGGLRYKNDFRRCGHEGVVRLTQYTDDNRREEPRPIFKHLDAMCD